MKTLDRKYIFRSLTLIMLILSLLLSSCGGFIGGGVTLGMALNALADQVQTAIQTAGHEVGVITVQAGAEVYNAIQAAKVAYQDSLNMTVDRLDASATKMLQQLQTMVNDLQSNVEALIKQAGEEAQQIVNTLPFANTRPQLTRFGPKFEAGSAGGGKVIFDMQGNFLFAASAKYQPSLQIGQKSYAPVQNTTQELKFESDPLPPGTNNQISLSSASLSIPYEEKMAWVIPWRKVATYNLLIGVLPPTPGIVTLNVLQRIPHTMTQHVITNQESQYSSNEDLKDVVHIGPGIPEGWDIVDSSVRFVVDWSQGDENNEWSKTLLRIRPSVAYKVTTIYHRFGTSGKVDFHFEYDLQKIVYEDRWSPTLVNITWGQTRAFPVEVNRWKINFKPFDGTPEQEIVSPVRNRYMITGIAGNQLTIRIPSADELQ